MLDRELQSLYEARYGSSQAAPDGPSNPFISTILSHKSVRRFRPDPLPDGTLEQLVAAAQSAATSSNLQAWSVIAIQDPERKAEAARLCGDQGFIQRAPLFLVFCADLARLTTISESADLPGEGLDYLEMFLVGTIDASLAAQNAALAAESLGLGICYVGAARNNPLELGQFLNLPPRVFALFGMAIGIPAEDDKSTVKPRLPQAALLHHESYQSSADSIEQYNEIMQNFYDSAGMDVKGNWSQHSARRVANEESLSGRHTLTTSLNTLGFPLK